MNLKEEKLLEILCELKDKYFVSSVKSEFESEGATFGEVAKLRELSSEAGMELTVKIGGCEAVNDMYQLREIGVDSIVAPMIESPFALKKYIQACKTIFDDAYPPKFYINIETIGGYKNLDDIVSSDFFSSLSGVVLGRSDFVGSLNLGKSDINSDLMFGYSFSVAQKVKEFKKEFVIGGQLNFDSIDFLKKFPVAGLDKFETRKIIFSADILLNDDDKLSYDALVKAFEFELLWLDYKRDYLGVKRAEDKSRMVMLESISNIKAAF